MYQMPPIIILNGIDNDNNQSGRFARMNDYCQDHTAHTAQINTNKDDISTIREDHKGMGSRISRRVKSQVFWTVIILMLGFMGAVFTKQEKVLEAVQGVSISQKTMEIHIGNMKEDISELKSKVN